MIDILAWKVCAKCGAEKTIDGFFKNSKSRDGRSSTCKECDKEHLKKWRNENKEKVRAQSKRSYYRHQEDRIQRAMKWNKEHPEISRKHIDNWHTAHPDKQREANKKSREKYPEKQAAKIKKYREENPEKSLEWAENRRSRKSRNGGSVSAKEWRDILVKYGNFCLCCKRSDVKLTMDHVVPLSVGGKHQADNIQPLCGRCNSSKSTKTIDYRPKEK